MFQSIHRQHKLIMRNVRKGGHYDYKTLYLEYTRFSKTLEYCYCCGNKVYLPSVHCALVCCVHFIRAIGGQLERERRKVFPRINIIEGWSLHRPSIRSQYNPYKIFSRRNNSFPNSTILTYL